MEEEFTPLVRKFAVCRNFGGDAMTRVYWNVEKKTWGPLHTATIFEQYGDSKFVANRLSQVGAESTAIWTDR